MGTGGLYAVARSRLCQCVGCEAAVPTPNDDVRDLREIAEEAGLRRIHVLAWRDLEDPEAGGSEVHAHEVASRWASAGLDVTMRTSAGAGLAHETRRSGYRVIRRSNRYSVFPSAALAELTRRHGRRDGLVEIWNGMPFFSPVWCRGPRAVWLHHVHAEMWNMTLPPGLASVGRAIEERLAPPLYRSSTVVTLSESSRRELLDDLGFDPTLVRVVPPGIDTSFTPGGSPSPTPLVVAVGRLTPVKRFHLLVDALVEAKRRVPALEAVIAGEGYERPELERRIADAGAGGWLSLPGRLPHKDIVDLYRRAWLVAASSVREGWGMTLTEAAACGTPAVATRISGHADAVIDGKSGLLVDAPELGGAIARVLEDEALRRELAEGALAHARGLTWEATARGTLQALADDARRRR
jgi:glycosyltransferase involved in cell wall biosynthesis